MQLSVDPVRLTGPTPDRPAEIGPRGAIAAKSPDAIGGAFEIPEKAKWNYDMFGVGGRVSPKGPFAIRLIAGPTVVLLASELTRYHHFGIAVALLIVSGNLVSTGRLLPDLKSDLRDLAPVEHVAIPQYLVSLRVEFNGRIRISDSGVLAFADDTLLFIGRSCSFVIGSQDLSGDTKRMRFANASPLLREPVSMRLKHPKGFLAITLKERWNIDRRVTGRFGSLRRQLDLFTGKPPTKEVRSYPPFWGDV